VPDDPHPSGDHCPGSRDLRGDDAGPLLPRRRVRREPERAHPRRPLAVPRRAHRDARGGYRGDPAPLAGRLPNAPRKALPGREGADLHPAGRAAADRRHRGRPGRSGARRTRRRRADLGLARRRARLGLPRSRRRRAALRAGDGLLGRDRGGRGEDRARVVAERRDPALPGARPAVRLRGRCPERRAGERRRADRVWAGPGAPSRADPKVRTGRVRPRLRPPGRARPGRFFPLLPRRDLSAPLATVRGVGFDGRSLPELRYVSWSEFDAICRGLARRLRGFELELVVGIARGGLPAAVHLAHLLEAPWFVSVHATKTTSNAAFAIAADDGVEVHGSMLPDVPARRALLVEDIVTFGDVFQRVTPLVRERYGSGLEVVHATLFADLEQIATGPNPGLLESLFYGEAIDNRAVWIVPPWDEKALEPA